VIKRLRGTSYQIKSIDPFAITPDEEIASPKNQKVDASNYLQNLSAQQLV
jgi:hypothetical protein